MRTRQERSSDPHPTPRLRQYLEQMMMAFVSIHVPVTQAADEVAEIEAHIIESGEDPFDLLGSPKALALSVIPPEQLTALKSAQTRQDIRLGLVFGPMMFALMQVARVGNHATAIGSIIVGLVLWTLFMLWSTTYATVIGQNYDDSLRPTGVPATFLISFAFLFVAWLGAKVAGWHFVEPRFDPGLGGWALILLVLVLIGGTLGYRAWKLRGPLTGPVGTGVTGEILHEMNTNGYTQGWIRFGVNGEDLRAPGYSTWQAAKDGWMNGSAS